MRFSVEINRALQSASDLERQRQQLTSCRETVSKVKSNCPCSGTTKKALVSTLNMVLAEMDNEANIYQAMSAALTQSAEYYRCNEEKIAKCEAGISVPWEAISEIVGEVEGGWEEDSENDIIKMLDVIKNEISAIPENAESAGDTLAWIEQWYETVPREVKGIVNVFVPSTLKKAYQVTGDLLQNEFTFDTLWDVGKSIAKSSPYVSAVFETLEYTFEKGVARNDEMQAELLAQLKEGDILGAVMDGDEGFIDIVLGGAIECGATLVGNTVDKYIGKIPVVGKAIEEGTKYITGMLLPGDEEYSLGGLVGVGGEAISAAIDYATDVITDATDVVTNSITSSVKNVCSWIGGLFD